MSEDNKRNILFFQAPSMRELYTAMDAWQVENRKRFHSLNVQPDEGGFSCIALSNPTEVIIVDGTDQGGVSVRERPPRTERGLVTVNGILT